MTPHTGDFIFTVYICAVQVMVSDACSIIGIHRERGAVAADLSIDGRGREAGTRDGERGRQGRDSAVVSVISCLEREALGTPLQEQVDGARTRPHTAERGRCQWQTSEAESIPVICAHQEGHIGRPAI